MTEEELGTVDFYAARRSGLEKAARWHDEQAEVYAELRKSHDCTNQYERSAWTLCRDREKIHRLSAQAIRGLL